MPSPLSGSAATAVSGPLTGLVPDTTYFYRLVASSAAGTAVDPLSPPRSFRTSPRIAAAAPTTPPPTSTAPAASAPLRIVGLSSAASTGHSTRLVLSFSEALNPVRARNPHNYRLTGPRGGRVPIVKVSYHPDSRTVTLRLGRRLVSGHGYRLRVNGNGRKGLTDVAGILLDGNGDGRPGGDYLAHIGRG
jgi:hypothetical protein